LMLATALHRTQSTGGRTDPDGALTHAISRVQSDSVFKDRGEDLCPPERAAEPSPGYLVCQRGLSGFCARFQSGRPAPFPGPPAGGVARGADSWIARGGSARNFSGSFRSSDFPRVSRAQRGDSPTLRAPHCRSSRHEEEGAGMRGSRRVRGSGPTGTQPPLEAGLRGAGLAAPSACCKRPRPVRSVRYRAWSTRPTKGRPLLRFSLPESITAFAPSDRGWLGRNHAARTPAGAVREARRGAGRAHSTATRQSLTGKGASSLMS
jgi:hypothetical protein